MSQAFDPRTLKPVEGSRFAQRWRQRGRAGLMLVLHRNAWLIFRGNFHMEVT
jgi:hypothetical protein